MIRRWMLAAALFLLSAALLLPLLAWNTHLLLSGAEPTISLTQCWAGLFYSSTAIRLYLLFLLGVASVLVWAVLSSSYLNNHSGMYVVQPGSTPEQRISIPRPDGHGEYGTAWWGSIGRLYSSARVKKDDTLKALLQQGTNNYKEVENAEVTLE